MAHNLNINNDVVSAAFATDKHGLPWHKLGQMVTGAMTWKEAVQLAHLDWTVEKRPIFFQNPLWKTDKTQSKGFKVPGQFVVCRNDVIGEKSALGIVGATYHPTQNIEIGSWIDNVLEQIDGAHYEAAGALGKGERVWALARVPFDISLGNDTHEMFLLFVNSHDGTMSNTIMITDVRAQCDNTINFALSHGTKDAMIKVRHTKGAQERLDKITESIQTGLIQDVQSLKEKFQKINNWKVTKKVIEKVFDNLLGENWFASKVQGAKAARIAELFKSNDNNAFPEQAGTGMALLNSVTNFIDHERPVRISKSSGYNTQEQVRADSAFIGIGSQLKTQTLELILEEVETKEAYNPHPTVQVSDEKKEALNNILNMIG